LRFDEITKTSDYDVWYNPEQKTALLKTVHTLVEENVHELVDLIHTEFESKGKEIRYLLVDSTHTGSDPVSKEARRALRMYSDVFFTFTKIAIVTSNPVTRMISKVALAAMGRSKVAKFFKTETGALEWLIEATE